MFHLSSRFHADPRYCHNSDTTEPMTEFEHSFFQSEFFFLIVSSPARNFRHRSFLFSIVLKLNHKMLNTVSLVK